MLFYKKQKSLDKTAIVSKGHSYDYKTLIENSDQLAYSLLNGAIDLAEQRVVTLITSSYEYVAVQWAIWKAGGVFVPMSTRLPIAALEHYIADATPSILIASNDQIEILNTYYDLSNIRLISLDSLFDDKGRLLISDKIMGTLPNIEPTRSAMMIYTSGSTGKPKGVVTTHQNITAQITTLVDAWEWSNEDHILNVLPMHHVHGLVNVTCCALWAGATVTMVPAFDTAVVFEYFLSGQINLFMAVPTVYVTLIEQYEREPFNKQRSISVALAQFRLMVSGSAALPISVLERWQHISQQRLLERYGMTEIGMGISNPYRGTREAGHIGQALPQVSVKLVNEQGTAVANGEAGEIWIKGPSVFKEYWNRPTATAEAFSEDGWFKTGDRALWNTELQSYRILGRNSVDIIKSGGYKISALEIEEVIRTFPSVKDCAVVGVPSEKWGQIIAACLVLKEEPFNQEELQLFLGKNLVDYKMPRLFKVINELPKNAMGKVMKKVLMEEKYQ